VIKLGGLNEAVIRRVVGGADTMRAQLERIAAIAELPNVTIQVLPLGAGVHPAMEGAFRILGFPEPSDPQVVFLENHVGGLYLEKQEEVDRYTLMFSHLMAKALDPGASLALIARVAAELARD
jgi:hypothetical protein